MTSAAPSLSHAPPPAAPSAIAACRDTYLANLAALHLSDPDLAARIEALPFAALPRLLPTRDGRWTAQVHAPAGAPVLLHSRYRPLDETTALVTAQLRARAAARQEGPSDSDDDSVGPKSDAQPASANETASDAPLLDEGRTHEAFLVTGLGLGYVIEALERRFREPLLVVIEPDLAVLKAALCASNLAGPLQAGRLILLTVPDKARIHERLRGVLTHLMLGLTLLTLPHTQASDRERCAELTSLVRDFITFSRLQVFSLVRNARTTVRNISFNLPRYLDGPGVEILERRATGYPAIVVAAGPSLARNIEQLAALRERAVIIAVQTVLKTLLSRGIPPHFVTSLDYHEISAHFFRDLTPDDVGDVALVAEPKAAWQVLDAYPGRVHVLHATLVDDLLGPAAPRRGALPAGSTVAHLAYYLAEHLGCDPIIFVGQDLSFTEGLYYPPGMPVERIWRPELGRFNTIEMKQWERIARMRAGLRRVPDVHGRLVYTDEQMYVYAEQFMSDFLQTSRQIIHASEGGMRLQGTRVMTLRDAAAQFCSRPLPQDLLSVGGAQPCDSTPGQAVDEPRRLRRAALAALAERQRELREVRQIANATSELLDRLVRLVDQPDAFNRLVAETDELRARMLRYGRTYELVVGVSQMAELRRIQADRSLSDDCEETPAVARRRLRRDRDFVTAFLDGCDFLMRMLPEAAARLEEGAA